MNTTNDPVRRAAMKAAWMESFNTEVKEILMRLHQGHRIRIEADRSQGLKVYERTLQIIKEIRNSAKTDPKISYMMPPDRSSITAWRRS